MKLGPADWEYVDERANGFSGRSWVFERLGAFLAGPAGCFLIVGVPGSGKTAISSFIAQLATGQLSPSVLCRAATVALHGRTVHAAYFCRSGRVDVLDVAQQLSDQLSSIALFAEVLKSTVASGVRVGDILVSVAGSVASGASVAGMHIALDALGPARAFSLGVALPLLRLRAEYRAQVVILIDGLDESIARPESRELSELLSKLGDVHMIVTTRPERQVLQHFEDHAQLLDLVADAPGDLDEVGAYVRARLEFIQNAKACEVLASRVSQAADGNFLYAFHVTGAIASKPGIARLDQLDAEKLELPEGNLPGVYREFIRRGIARDPSNWSVRFAPVLGPIAAGFGSGLNSTELSEIASQYTETSISRRQVRDVVRFCAQFLEGPQPDGPFRVYHQSFSDFLLDSTGNPDYCLDLEAIHRAIVATYQKQSREHWREYAWLHLMQHAHAAGDARGDFGELFALADTGMLQDALAATGSLPVVAAGFDMLFAACERLGDLPLCIQYAWTKQRALSVPREELRATQFALLRLQLLPPEEREAAAKRTLSAAILLPDAREQAEVLLAFYRECPVDLAGSEVVHMLPQAILKLVQGLPSSQSKMDLTENVIAAVAQLQPERLGWIEGLELEVAFPSIVQVWLARGYARTGNQAQAHKALRQALMGVEDDVAYVTLEPSQFLEVSLQITDASLREDLQQLAAARARLTNWRPRALLIRAGLLAQLGREAEAAALITPFLKSLAMRAQGLSDEQAWQLALAAETATEVLLCFRDQDHARQLEGCIVAIHHHLRGDAARRVASALTVLFAKRVAAGLRDAVASVQDVAKLLPIELGRYGGGQASLLALIEHKARNGDALLELADALTRTLAPEPRMSVSAAVVVALFSCGKVLEARRWYENEVHVVEAATDVNPETLVSLSTAAHAIGEIAGARHLLDRAFVLLSQIKDSFDYRSAFDEMLKALERMTDPHLQSTGWQRLIQATNWMTDRAHSVSEVCCQVRGDGEPRLQREVVKLALRCLEEPPTTAATVGALMASVRALNACGASNKARVALDRAHQMFDALADERAKPSLCSTILRTGNDALDRQSASRLVEAVERFSNANLGAAAIGTAAPQLGPHLSQLVVRKTLERVLERVEGELDGLNRTGALGRLAGAGVVAWDDRDLPTLERIERSVAAARPEADEESFDIGCWLAARASCYLARLACTGVADDFFSDVLCNELLAASIARATWWDHPTELVRALLQADTNDGSCDRLDMVTTRVRQNAVASAVWAREIGEILLGSIGSPRGDWQPFQPLELQKAKILGTMVDLINIAIEAPGSGHDRELVVHVALSAQALLASIVAVDDPERAAELVVDASGRISRIRDEQPRVWSWTSLIRHCPEGTTCRLQVERMVRDLIPAVGDEYNRSRVVAAYLESTPIERIGDVRPWLRQIGAHQWPELFANIATSFMNRPHVSEHLPWYLLQAAAVGSRAGLLLVTAEVTRLAASQASTKFERVKRLRSLLERVTLLN